LALCLSKENKKKEALAILAKALGIWPGNNALNYFKNIIIDDDKNSHNGKHATLFNVYAKKYDVHLKDTLHYTAPEEMLTLFMKHQKGKRNIIDIGCGTGFCGEVFKPIAKTLLGIDFSKKHVGEGC